jgi:branched-chain amino acid transport system permease protein
LQDVIYFTLLGIGVGAFYALLGAGIVVAFKGSGVINFAHGAVAMYTAFQFYYLRKRADFTFPWFDIIPDVGPLPDIPTKVNFGDRMAFVPAFLLAMLTAVGIGALMHFLVFRPLRNAAPLGKVIGSLGIMLYLQGVALLNFGTDNPQPETVLFPKKLFKNFLGFGRTFDYERLALLVLAVIVGAALWFVYRYTRFGLATRAAAGNEKGAVLLGYSPERLALTNWIVAAAVAGLAGICVGSITGALSQTKFTLLIVPALGAALIGGLSSIPVAVAGGVALGMLETFTTSWLRQQGWIPDDWFSGLKDAVPLVVIVLVLFLRGRSLPIRGTVEEKRLPLSPNPVRIGWWVAIAGGTACVAAYVFTSNFSLALSTSLLTSMLMLSYVVLTGYVGQISLMQLSIAGVAAFFLARMMANGKTTVNNPFPVSGPDLPWWLAAILAIAVATIVGILLGLPALRIRGVQLAVVTIAAALAIQTLYLENPELTGLRAGVNAQVKAPSIFGYSLDSQGSGGLRDRPAFVVFCAVVLALLAVAVANLRRSGTGRRLLAVRANERAAASSGIDVSRTKLLAFGISSAIAAVYGVMFAFQQKEVSSASWGFFLSLGFLAFVYLAGITSINGAIIGGLLAAGGLVTAFGDYHYRGLTDYVSILGGIGLVLTAILHPEGQAPFFQPAMRYLGSWLVHARGREWLAAIRKFTPGAIPGAVIAGLLIWANARTFNWPWHPLIMIGVGLMSRSIALQIWNGVRGKGGGGHGPLSLPSGPPVAAPTEPAAAGATLVTPEVSR